MPRSKETEKERSLLNAWFPHTRNPVIASAPMLEYANGTLAAQVSKAGGLGVVPGGFLFTPDSPQLVTLAQELRTARKILGLEEQPLTPIPVAVGFLLFHESISQFETTVLPLLQEHSPQAVWLFAHKPQDAAVVRDIIEVLQHSGILAICQVGNVEAARQATRDGADIIVAQGADAGGHQWVQSSGLISLVPEVRTMLDTEFPGRQVALLAAGGIVEGRGVAAALTLGADGVVMGTRFLIAKEASTPEFHRNAVTEAVDGGASTVKSTFHDDLNNMNIWPSTYDGRAIVTESYKDHLAGLSLEENLKKFAEAKEADDASRFIMWAGAGVGLVKEALPAGDIVRKTREEAIARMQALQSLF
ncbi:FMN-dependent 2-nitropropane dioxygenase [Thozetella sp. PMI_491]|nr:FMN-dependent 2-nitropropane dioxygenase [Thozetella sp. PMI_491]